MTIIKLASSENGQHPVQSQSGRDACWLDGWIAVPEELERSVWETLGWCDLQIDDGKLVGVTPTERPELAPLPKPQPDGEAVTWEALAQAYFQGVSDA